MSRLLRVVCALAVLGLLPCAAAAVPRLSVDVVGDCVDAGAVRSAVEGAMGTARDLDVTVRVSCGEAIEVELDLARAHASTSRRLVLAPDEREDLAAALALAVGLAVDGLERSHIEASRIASAIAPMPPATPSVEPRPERGVALEIMVHGGALAGLAPSIVPVFGAGIALRFDRTLSLALDAIGTTPVGTPFGEGNVRLASASGRLSGCADGVVDTVELGGCVGAWVGGMYGATSALRFASLDAWGAWVGLDGRVRATITTGAFFVRAELGVLGVVWAPSFVVDAGDGGVVAARAGPLAGSAELILGVRLVP